MKYLLASLLVGILLLSNSAANLAWSAKTPGDTCLITMGWEPWKPYQFMDDDETLTGFDIELISAIFEELPCDLEFKQINWARGLIELRSGEIDLLPHADFTQERSGWAHFSDSYRDVSQVLYVKKGDAEKFPLKTLEDIISLDFRLGVGRGVFIGDKFVELMEDKEFKQHIFYLPTDEMQQYQILQADRIHGYVRSVTAYQSLQAQLGDSLNLEIHPLHILTSKQHVMFSIESVPEQLVELFNAELGNVISRGIYKDLEEKFLN